jgi:hypothetical protein
MSLTLKPLALLLLPAAILAACGDKPTEYPKDVRTNFIAACMAQTPSEPLCTCMLSKIEKKWSLDAYTKLETTLTVAPGSAEAVAAVESFKEMAAACSKGE